MLAMAESDWLYSFFKLEHRMKNLFCSVCLLIATAVFGEDIRILAFAGSTRADSYNQQLIQEVAGVAGKMGAKVTVVRLSDYPMPFYDADLEQKEGMPKNAKRLRQLMIDSDAIIIASPEYNHSISGVLKNALDWISRSEDGNGSYEASKGKVFALMSASPGKKGGQRALAHLNEIIGDLKGTVIEQKVSIPHAYKYFGEKERGENPAVKKAIEELLAACKK